MKNWAEKFADRLFRDNVRLIKFEVALLDPEHLDSVADRLREYGCLVEVDRKKGRIAVDCTHASGPASPEATSSP